MYIRVSELLMKKISLDPPQSPYSKGFEDCLDPKMKKIVLTLVNKGLLPSSSCQGHSLLEPRYVVLCFGSQSERNDFKNSLPGFFTRESDTQSKEVIDDQEFVHQSREDEIRGFNYLFVRNYEQYWFLRIYLGAFVEIGKDEPWFLVKGKQLITILLNLCLRELHTKYFLKRLNHSVVE